MKYVFVTEEFALVLCKEHALEFEQKAREDDRDFMFMEFEDADVQNAPCASCKILDGLNNYVNRCH